MFVPEGDPTPLQMALARSGWNSRVFVELDERIWPGLIRNLPVAFVVRPGVDPERVAKELAAHAQLRGVPLVVCGDVPPGVPGLPVPSDSITDLAEALDALRDSWS